MKIKKQPEVRFDNYTNEWKMKALKHIVNRVTRKNKELKTQLPLTISAQYGLVDQVTYFNKQVASKDMSNYYLLERGEFAYNKSYSRDYPWGAIKRLDNYDMGALSSLYITFKPFMVNSDFLLSYYDTNKWHKEISTRATEGARNHGLLNISANDFLETELALPIEEEQEKVGSFFKQLDEAISLHQQELDTLKQTKQGFLQKMFPQEGESVPELRFPGFTNDWKLASLESLIDRIQSYSLSRAVETKENTRYKYIHYGDIHTNVAGIVDESSNLPNIQGGNYELLKKGDLVLADASEDYQGIATPALINIETPYNLVAGLHTIALRPKIKEVDSLFLYYLIKSPIFKRYGYKVGTGMKVFGISTTNLLKFEGLFPKVDEQKKIGDFLINFDKVITLYQQELDALKQTKKAFLQKMFV